MKTSSIHRLSPFITPSGASASSTERSLSRDEILRLQRTLVALGFTDGGAMSPDGVIGPRTRAAVTAYQRSRNLRVDGVIGPETIASLNGESGGVQSTTTTPAATTPAATTPAATTPTPHPATANVAGRSNWPLAIGVGLVVLGGAYMARRDSRRKVL